MLVYVHLRMKYFLFTLSVLMSLFLPAQQTAHFVRANYAAALNKQAFFAGYSIGMRRICFDISAGKATGFDNRFLPADKLNDNKEKQKVNGSLVLEPVGLPSQTYLEECNSTYKGNQFRLGFTVFLWRTDTLGRHPFAGPHAGVDVVYMRAYETQTATFKSETSESRYTYTGSRNYRCLGAATHIGWQFAFLKEHLYVDLRAVVPFFYPFVEEPNLNAPFSGTKYEYQVGLAWHFAKWKKEEEPKDGGKGKVRQGL
jgi:hypothetical protein